MIEVIDQYGERHRFDDNHCIHDADSATGMVQIGVSNDSGDYDVVATFLHPARFGEVSDDTCFTLREVPAGIARQIEELRAENKKLKADAKYGWQAHELMLKNQALEAELADAKENAREWKLAASAATDMLETEREKVKALEATWIGYNKLQEQLAAAQATIAEMPKEAIGKCLADLMDVYVKNGADSVSMPDECVEVAYWLANIPTNQDALCEALARECERLATIRRGPLFPSWVRKESVAEYLETEAAVHRTKKGEVK